MEYLEEYKQKNREAQKRYRKKHKDKLKEKRKEYVKNNREKIIKAQRIWNNKNKDHVLAYRRKYGKEYYKKNKKKVAIREYAHRIFTELVFKKFNNMCCICGCKENLEMHHDKYTKEMEELDYYAEVVILISIRDLISKSNYFITNSHLGQT